MRPGSWGYVAPKNRVTHVTGVTMLSNRLYLLGIY